MQSERGMEVGGGGGDSNAKSEREKDAKSEGGNTKLERKMQN